jgi:hypothetical protein
MKNEVLASQLLDMTKKVNKNGDSTKDIALKLALVALAKGLLNKNDNR